jgi:hypothetical protein
VNEHIVNVIIALLVAWRALPDFARVVYYPGNLGLRTPFAAGIAIVIVCILTLMLPTLKRELLTALGAIVGLTAVGVLAETLSMKCRIRAALRGMIRVTDAYALGADALMLLGLLGLTVHAAQ